MAKRLGRGYGSGKGGHTSGRGQKGQKARTKIHILFEGVKVKKSTLKKLPLLRGKGKFLAKKKPITLSQDELKVFKRGEKVDLNSLIEKGLISKKDAYNFGVKILGKGSFKKDLEILVPMSK